MQFTVVLEPAEEAIICYLEGLKRVNRIKAFCHALKREVEVMV